MSLLELGYNLLLKLDIHRLYVLKDHLEIHYEGGGKQIIAFGKTENEVIENFYELYEQAFNPDKSV